MAFVLILACLTPMGVEAQGGDPPDEDAGVEPPETETRLEDQQRQIEELRQELQAQRAELERQRAEARQRELEARKARRQQGTESESDEEDELDAILADVDGGGDGGSQVQAFEPSFTLYGFADMGLQRFWGSNLVEKSVRSNGATFVMGNVNVYFDAKPARDWRFLTEVRFSLLPEGAENLFEGTSFIAPEDSAVFDPTSPSNGYNKVDLGSIIIERSHIDYSFRDWLNVRTGLFLTPLGIWNVDHGTPTLVSTTFPGFQVVNLFPERQLGVELFGSLHKGHWELAYHAYVSNGRMDGQLDLTDDKAGGLRFVARTRRPFPMQFGVSGYAGSFEKGHKQGVLSADGVRLEQVFTKAYKEQTIAADVSLDIEDLRIRGEVVARRMRFEEGKRTSERNLGLLADRSDLGAYLLLAYRLPWAGLEPFVFMDFLKWPAVLGEAMLFPSAGLNVHFDPSVVLKFQYTYLTFVDLRTDLPPVDGAGHMHMLLSRLAIAF